MAQPYVGEIRMFGGNFAPAGWMFCNGDLLPISENETLFQLIGTTYGGDGESTFGLPNLQSRIPIHQGQGSGLTNRVLAEMGGTESVTLTTQQMPSHTHPMIAAGTNGTATSPQSNLSANSFNVTPYINQSPDGAMNAGAVVPVGGSQPHENCQPFLCVSYIISLFGLYPSPT
jgi:microcystin-dependent protein